MWSAEFDAARIATFDGIILRCMVLTVRKGSSGDL